MKTKTIGILGGMGPHATVDLFRKIIEATPAQRDQEHLRILVNNNPGIPDRTQAILGKGKSPLPTMIDTGTIKSKVYHQVFERMGWEVITPKETGQAIVMKVIYGEEGIKTGELEKPKAKIIKVARELLGMGAEIIVAGCTEVPLVLRKEDLSIPVVDPTEILARTVVKEATNLPRRHCKL